jgi:hypothetical protein
LTRSALPNPVEPDTTVFDRAESGRHRHSARRHPAAMVTAAIAVGSVALAGFAAVGATAGPDTSQAQASLTGAAPLAAEGALSSVQDAAREQTDELLRLDTIADEQAALTISQSSAATGAKAAEKAADRIAADRKAEEEAAERRAEAAAAEEAAAEQAAAEAAAQEAAAQEEAAAEQEPQAASRSAEREPAPEPAPAPSGDPRSIARSMLSSYGWGQDQFGCLDSLWMKESGWNASAMNPSSGAYGIPQSLPGNKMASAGSDWQTNPATQIRWGLGYIDGRYGSPCAAWAHSQAVNWY